MARRRKRPPDTGSIETGLPAILDDKLKLALSTAAGLTGEAGRCTRRSCRQAGRCHAAAEGRWCSLPLSQRCHDMAHGMMVFSARLLLDRP